jgi:Endonuclease-reverse transcriptase
MAPPNPPMPTIEKPAKSPLINIYCLNTAHSNQICHTALNLASTHERNFDIILFQEPWYGSITSADDIRGGVSMQGWQPIMPTSPVPEDRYPRVMAYIHIEANLNIVARSDLIDDLDIQILDVRCQGANQPITQLVNIYNQSAAEEADGFSVDWLCEIIFDKDIATILTGDWNLRHPICHAMNGNGDQCTQDTVLWLQENDFTICNPHNLTTWQSKSAEFLSPLDLTFTNQRADDVHALTKWSVEKEFNADSDHYAVFFSIENAGEEISNLSQAKFNWKHVNKQTFTKTLYRAIHNNDRYNEVFRPLMNHTLHPVSPLQLDDATKLLQDAMQTATLATVPVQHASPRAKPWWTPELTAALNSISVARMSIGDTLAMGQEVSEMAKNNIIHLHAVFKRQYHRTKASYYNTLVKGATPQTLYSFAKWTQGSCQLMSPPIERGVGTEPVVSHKDKCDTLREALFPVLPALPDARYPNMNVHDTDIEWVKVMKCEVHDSIFKAAPLNVPGMSEMTGRAYQWAWEVAEEDLFLICTLAIKIGHHPEPFHTSIAVALWKPKKDSYSKPRSYRLIQLLEVLGKAIEHIVAQHMAYLAVSHKLLPADQFGGVPGRSAEDAALSAVHDIEAAQNV